MLYDPKWEQRVDVPTTPFSLRSLIAWLEKQPPEQTYIWHDCRGGCLIGKYYSDIGISPSESYAKVFDGLPGWTYAGVCSSLVGPSTFGSALERARKIAARPEILGLTQIRTLRD